MKKIINNGTWILFSLSCILIGLYPIIYFVIDRKFGLLSTKPAELLLDTAWNVGFYIHIVLGGIALLIGWSQFSSKFRKTRMSLHRTIGKIYVVCALISGIAGIFIAQSATGGLSNVIGFSLSGIIWFCTTLMADLSIRKGKVEKHQEFMIYSYAVCFSAVTLRIWLGILTSLTDFFTAYLIVGYLSWVPNLIVAYFIIQRLRRNS